MYQRVFHRLRLPPWWFVPLTLGLFVLTWPLERRHLRYTSYSFLTGRFTEEATMALYASDIAFLLLLAGWLWERRSHRDNSLRPRGELRGVAVQGVVLLLWAFVRSFSHPNDPSLTILGIYSTARIAQGVLFMLIISDAWRRGVLKSILLWTLVSVGTMQSVLGVSQVFRGSDFGLRITGEQPLSIHVPGVAKVDVPTGTPTDAGLTVNGVPTGTIKKTLRAYGTLQHPNILGGVLLACLAASMAITLSKNSSSKTFIVLVAHGTTVGGIIGTFSRSAWISAAFILLGTIFCSCGKILTKRLKQLTYFTIIIITIVVVSSKHIRETVWSRIVPAGTDQFITARSEAKRDFSSVIRGRYLGGIGNGIGFIETVRNVRNIDRIQKTKHNNEREYWQYQYPHSVPLVIILELGLVGLGLISVLIIRVLKITHARFRETWTSVHRLGIVFLVLGILIPLLTDHYLWTSQQGRILLWGVLGTILGIATAPPPEDASPARISRGG